MSHAHTASSIPRLAANLLWVDCSAGALVGVFVLLLREPFAALTGLPPALVLGMGLANLGYALYSFTLARRPTRPRAALALLVAANAAWGLLCLVLAALLWDQATVLGRAQLVLEGFFVGGLAYLEGRWFNLLLGPRAASSGS